MAWLKSHWKAVLVSVVVFFVGAGIGTSGSSGGTNSTTIVRDHTLTAEGAPAAAGTRTVTETETVTATVRAKPKPAAPRVVKFSGNGGQTLPRFVVSHDAILHWTCDGDIFQIFDMNPSDLGGIEVNSQAPSGQTAVSTGTYSKIEVNALGNWTITIR